jgi:hypothetical protein
MSLTNAQNYLNVANDASYTGLLLAFPATGSFTLSKILPTVTMKPSTLLQSSDVTGSLQLNIPLSYFTINSSTDSSGNLSTDFITFTADNLRTILNTNPDIPTIASSGRLSEIFLNYDNYVAAYFGNTNGFTLPYSLLISENINSYNANGYIDGFTTSAAERILTKNQIASLLNTNDLSGSLTIRNLTTLLRYVCTQNTFGNRTNTTTFTEGFKVGDLIYFTSGIQISLRTNITSNGINKISSTASSTSFNNIDNSFNILYDVTNTSGILMNYTFSNVGTSYLNLNVSIPLLLRIV